MRLAQFILTHKDAILESWDSFAKSLQPHTHAMDAKETRDHAAQVLDEIAADISKPQTAQESVDKSRGGGPKTKDDTASQTHGGTRLRSGFSVEELISEYRALRSSVLLLWSQQDDQDSACTRQDTLRFNEAIDKGLSEAVARYSRTVNESQDVLLGVLGHDLRSPLTAILLSAEVFLNADQLDSRYTKLAAGIYSSVRRADKIVENLLDFARSRVGGGITLDRAETDLTAVCENIAGEVRTLHPERIIEFKPDRHISGLFDAARMGQVFSNLMGNAVKHGSHVAPVIISQRVDNGHAVMSIHNEGETIPASEISRIFDPMARHSQYARNERGPRGGLGLGLFIAREIVTAHGGEIKVESSAESGTTFRVHVPLNTLVDR